jgi:hypothetical protein
MAYRGTYSNQGTYCMYALVWFKVESLRKVPGFEWAVRGPSLDDETDNTPASGGFQTWDFQRVGVIGTLKRRGGTVRINKATGSSYGYGWVQTRRQRGCKRGRGFEEG